MLRHNVFACARDTSEGVRKPRLPTAARSGPYPPLDPSNHPGEAGGDILRRPSFNAIGTASNPVVVVPDSVQAAGESACQ